MFNVRTEDRELQIVSCGRRGSAECGVRVRSTDFSLRQKRALARACNTDFSLRQKRALARAPLPSHRIFILLHAT